MSRKIVPEADVIQRVLVESSILLDVDSGASYQLDETGTQIWKLIVENEDLDLVEQKLAEVFEGERETITADVSEFVERLVDKGLVRVEGSGSGKAESDV